jgi:hypothetical protein
LEQIEEEMGVGRIIVILANEPAGRGVSETNRRKQT